MKHIFDSKTFEETWRPHGINDICKKLDIKNYVINSDLSIDVNGSVDLSNMDLGKIPLNFNYVSESFYCQGNQLKSLKGCPIEVGYDFFAHNNELVTLESGPKTVGRHYYISNNKLVSLKWFAKNLSIATTLNFRSRVQISNNNLPVEITNNIAYIEDIVNLQEDYGIWNSDCSLNKYRFEDMMVEIKLKYED